MSKVAIADLPVIDLSAYVSPSGPKPDFNANQCQEVADCLRKYGVLVIKDPRATEDNNAEFLDMMESYFEQCDFVKDARPEHSFQVGVTPELKELPRNHCTRVEEKLAEEHKPVTLCPPELDKKSRFFWRIGDRPAATRFTELNAEPVVPEQFQGVWEKTMNMWGGKMLAALHELVQMAAIGLDLPSNSFVDKMNFGPHLLAPTGSNLDKHGQLNAVLAGYHYDLNLLTIHGKSRFPGLYIWLRDGRKSLVKVPDGCLLIQAGKQLEYLTGGYIQAGFHEVIVSPETMDRIEVRKQNKQSLWRVSSTLFSHTASDEELKPLGKYATEEACKLYPTILAGNQVRKELSMIELGEGYTLNREE